MTADKCFFVTLLISLFASTAGFAVDNMFLHSGGGSYYIKTSTLKDYRYRDTIVQQRDFSCGSAALATMLHYHYGRPITETEALQAMYAAGDKKKIEKEGFSLLDMKRYLATIGLQAEGYRVSLDKLAEVGIPAIALVNINGYLHFVLVRGISDSEVLVADPALGMKTYSRSKFEEMWNKIFFVIVSEKEQGQKTFNLAKYWGRALSDHDLQNLLFDNDIAEFTLHISRSPGYF